MYRIEAAVMVPGRGQPVKDGCVIIDGLTLRYAGPQAGAPDTPAAEVFRVPAVMPGMWDCHGHFDGTVVPDPATLATTPPAVAAMRVVGDAQRALDAGFTSVREVGVSGSGWPRRWRRDRSSDRACTGPVRY